MKEVAERSYEPLHTDDLRRLADLAMLDLDAFFQRNIETARLYKDRLLGLALCQGAAEHFVRPGHGVKDLDVWVFFARNSVRPFPYRRRGCVDFGPSPLGRHPADKGYKGRRVDVIGRDISVEEEQSPSDAIRRYISQMRSKSARCLRMRPVVMLYPSPDLGRIVWDPKGR